jgi:hypothetical protein
MHLLSTRGENPGMWSKGLIKKLEAQYSIKNGQGKSSKGGKPASSSSQNQSSGNGASPNRL